MTDFEIRPLAGMAEYRACVELQEETWGRGFSERVPPALLKVSQLLGGVASGAWADDGSLVGFVFGMTGPRDGRLVHWSDMLAVRPDLRNSGLGRALKVHQRDVVRRHGVRTILWTFDPLRTRNAHLNFARLGARAREYVVDMYGQTDSPLHRGIGTDRLIVEWSLDDPRVDRRLAGTDRVPGQVEAGRHPAALAADLTGPLPLPGPVTPPLDAERVRISVPPDIQALMDRAPDVARSWREATRVALLAYLDEGWTVDEFVRDARTPCYVLTRPPAPPP